MIELNDVSKRFGQNFAVRGLTLSVPAGQIYGLLGHNGAGKSTAIGMMLGQVWPTAGVVRICGHEVHSQRQRALSDVGAIFESPAFYDFLSGFRNLAILSSYTAPVSRGRIEEVLEWVGLTGCERAKVRTYSHGMRARLALAQALLPKPKLLILDEPSDGLDPEGIHDMRQTIQRLHRELGLTILLSSHFLAEVEQLCGRIAVLNRGKLVFEGSILDTRARVQRIRLETSDFDAATRHLLAAGLISGAVEPGIVNLRDGVGTETVIQELVRARIPLSELCREHQTLEQFYLALMSEERRSRAGKSNTANVSPAST